MRQILRCDAAAGIADDNDRRSAEDLIAANPDAIFMVWYNGYTVNDTDYAGEQVVELITENPAFASLDAVKNRIVRLSPRLPAALFFSSFGVFFVC